MSTTDLTTWSLMVRIYAESCCPSEATDVFREIQARGMRPNTVTIMNLLLVCAQLKNAYSIFQSDGHRDLVMFTAMPDHVFITTLLTACCHAGLIQDGLQILDSIRTVYCMKPTMEQYGSVVDLLARGVQLDDAYIFATEMLVGPNANIWGTLSRACTTYNRIDLGAQLQIIFCKVNLKTQGTMFWSCFDLLKALCHQMKEPVAF
ncbi:hypothetical protein Bca4012_012505 [Brassica carinata]|uniref:Pentatricopeptide repeat-containing protein n=1 Tax=Brassica carinata TaxID=52824 RepID=A0A8X7V4L6_BRACI|nr:hypothetical protein Bca52824_037253 [Brassica carinata]